jgi:hypothetical protein
MAGTVLCVALLVPLAIPGYMFGSWRWLRRDTNTWEMGAMLFAFFLVWYVVLRVSGGSQVLVPIAMLVATGSFGVGWLAYERERRARRRPE